DACVAGLARDLKAKLAGEAKHAGVARKSRTEERCKTVLSRVSDELLKKHGAEATVLPVIPQDNRELCLVARRLHIARDAELALAPTVRRDRDQRSFTARIDVGEAPEFRRRESAWRHQSLVAGVGRKAVDELGLEREVVS